MPYCRAVQQSDEMFCAPCGLRWDVNDRDPPPCRPEMTSTETDRTTRDTLEKVAKGYHELIAIQAKQRETMALLIRSCVARLKSPDSRKRKEAMEGLEQLAEMLEERL